MTIKEKISRILFRKKEQQPAKAYDIWSASYDFQPDNLMLALDEQLVNDLLTQVSLENKQIADIGCGTGRHWSKIFGARPGSLSGFDVSAGMLEKLKEKYPHSKTILIQDELLYGVENASFDFIISTLTIAHIKDAGKALQEWNRILKKGGEIILTDFHPALLAKGGQRTFSHEGKIIAVKNYLHTIEEIKQITGQLGWVVNRFRELIIDDSMKPYYEKQHALNVFEKYKGTPLIYGFYFKKP